MFLNLFGMSAFIFVALSLTSRNSQSNSTYNCKSQYKPLSNWLLGSGIWVIEENTKIFSLLLQRNLKQCLKKLNILLGNHQFEKYLFIYTSVRIHNKKEEVNDLYQCFLTPFQNYFPFSTIGQGSDDLSHNPKFQQQNILIGIECVYMNKIQMKLMKISLLWWKPKLNFNE